MIKHLHVRSFALRSSLGLLLLFWGLSARAQDVFVPPNCTAQPTCTFTPAGGIPWSGGNLSFVFTPIDPRATVEIFVHNLNPTSAHTSQTLSVWQTPFGQAQAANFSKNTSKWIQDVVTQNSTLGASCNSVNANNDTAPGASGLGSCFVNTTYAAQLAIQITGASTASGSPDNFELAIVQHVAPISGAQGGTVATGLSSANSGTAAPPPIQVASDAISQAFSVQPGTITNPALGQQIIHVNANNGSRSLYFDKIVVSCSAACSITINETSTTGTTCTTFIPGNLKVNVPISSTSLANTNCTTLPNPVNPLVGGLPLAAGTPFIVDLKGVIAPNGTTTGVDVVMAAALTGTINASEFWYEK